MVLKVLNTVAYLLMIAVNVLAEVLPLNGVTTAEVSASYPTLITPAAYTFSIWGLIYLLLAGFLVYQFLPLSRSNGSKDSKGGKRAKWSSGKRDRIIYDIGWFFLISCLANAVWIIAWHYRLIPLSVGMILILLVCLAVIVSRILRHEPLTLGEKLLVKLPFSIYYGWVTVAAIVNIAVLSVSQGWSSGGISQEQWALLLLFAGLLIAAEIMLKNGDIAYGLTVFWAYAGILYQHISPNGFSGKYSVIITAAEIALCVLAAEAVYLAFLKRKAQKNAGNKAV